jgi:putative flippase GtrA
MGIIKKIKETFLSPRFIKFFVTGTSVFIFDLTIFTIGTKLGLQTLVANSISIVFAIILNYTINRFWVFQSKTKEVGVEFGKFLGVQVINFIQNNLLVLIFSQIALNVFLLNIFTALPFTIDFINSFLSNSENNKLIAKVLATSIQIVTSFVLYRMLVFKDKTKSDHRHEN